MPFEKKVDVEALKPGMYVSRLDRPWIETPFPFQGFTLRSGHETRQLRVHCRYVYIDIERGDDTSEELIDESRSLDQQVVDLLRRPLAQQIYPITATLDDERAASQESHRRLQTALADIYDDIQAGKNVSLREAKLAVEGMTASIVRNPDAFIWLTRLKRKDTYAYAHAIDTSALAANFGRHLGLSRAELNELALATLLLDIGKIKLPDEMLAKPGKLTDAEFKLMRRHVQFSLELLGSCRGIGKETLKTIATHHERHAGHGYPRRLRGLEIPVFGRIAGIVDCYDAVTSVRPFAKALSQYEAIRKLYEWRDQDFQADIVEQFIQCLGVYPTGSLVELTTGQVGIVLAQNPVRRLKPVLMLILDEDKIAYNFQPRLDLVNEDQTAAGEPIEILRALEPGSYGIDPADYYI